MRKLPSLLVAASLAMMCISSAADAARLAPPAPSPSTPNGNQPTCNVACTPIIVPPHADCAAPKPVTLAPAHAKIVLGGPKKDPCASAGSADFQACGEKLGNLRRVTVAQVRRIDDNDKVHLVPICDTVHRSLTQVETTYLARGNVQGLILPISQNDTLMAALDDGGYRARNVLGIVRSQDMVILYVSRAPL
jgi:hypothetical protein